MFLSYVVKRRKKTNMNVTKKLNLRPLCMYPVCNSIEIRVGTTCFKIDAKTGAELNKTGKKSLRKRRHFQD